MYLCYFWAGVRENISGGSLISENMMYDFYSILVYLVYLDLVSISVLTLKALALIGPLKVSK